MTNKHEVKQDYSLINRAKHVGAGLALSTVAIAGGVLVAEGAISATQNLAITTEHAQPSNMLADSFTVMEEVGAAIGTGVLIKRGVGELLLAHSPKNTALNAVAHSSSKNKKIASHKVPRALASIGMLTTSTGIVAGNFFNIADNVSNTQTNVATLFKGFFPHDKSNEFVVSNNPTPNMLNASTINSTELASIEKDETKLNLQVVPAYHDWGGGSYDQKNTKNNQQKANNDDLEFMTIGLPRAVTKLPDSNESCSNIEVSAPSALGVKKGEFFDLQGVRVKVASVFSGHSGFNLLPVILNDTTYRQCILTPNSPNSMAIIAGSKANVNAAIEDANPTHDASERLYAVPVSQFITNAENTGKNAVNGLVLEALIIGMALGAVALNHQTSQELANNRSQNRMLRANGYNERLILEIYKKKAEADAVAAALLAMLGTTVVDTLVNHAQPGGALGINLETYAAVTGFLWAIKRVSTSRAVRKEAAMMERGES